MGRWHTGALNWFGIPPSGERNWLIHSAFAKPSTRLGGMNVHAPIGVFDSGLGGLSVAREICAMLPRESLIYAADNRFCPYGSRTPEEISWRTLLLTERLVSAGAKLLVIACNTASAVALDALRARFGLPIVGLEPAVKPAVQNSKTGVIGLLATPTTVASERLQRLIARYAGEHATVITVAAPGLVELVEAGAIQGSACRAAVWTYVQPLVRAGVDTIVLGCTHYPFLRDLVQEVAGPNVAVIDSGAAVARRTANLLDFAHGHSPATRGSIEIRTTGDLAHVRAVAHRLWHEPVSVCPLDVPCTNFA